jgi:hypothetical protein
MGPISIHHMGTRTALGTILFVVAGLTASACKYDDGGTSGSVTVERDAGASPGRPDARGPSVTSADARPEAAPLPTDAAGAAPDAALGGTPDAIAEPDVAPAADAAAPPPPPPPGPPAACATPAALPVSFRRLGQGPRSDDFTFDRDGHLIAFDGMDFGRVPRLGSFEVIARDVIGNRGGALRMVASGDVYLADYQRDQVLVVAPGATPRRLPSTINSPMKMVSGPGGALYVTGQQGTVYRIDPATGAVATAATTGFRVGGLSFTSDHRSLIVGGLGQGLHALDRRPDGTLAPPRSFADLRDAQALAADACGNLYAVVENDSRVRRIGADGKVDVVADLRGVYAWSLAFGSGQQGWSATALYVMEATGPMYELAVAVPGQGPPLAASD